MKKTSFFPYITKRIIIILAILTALAAGGYYMWQRNKVGFVSNKIKDEVLSKTDSLYNVTFDSLYFDEVNGEAYMKNIRIIPDTARALLYTADQQPYVLLDISVRSLMVKGVKTPEAMQGNEIVGDSIIVTDPVINLYFLKKLSKETKIEKEATAVYKQILGKLNLIQVGKVVVNNVNVNAYDLKDNTKDFELKNAEISLYDVRIDSLHDLDTSRILYCRQAYFKVEQFNTFDNNRPEAIVKNLVFMGKEKRLSVQNFSINRHVSPTGKGELLAEVENFICDGVHSNEFVKEKRILVDSIWAKSISFFRQDGFFAELKGDPAKENIRDDTTGFIHAYSLAVEQLFFPEILIKESGSVADRKNIELGKISLKIRNAGAEEVALLKEEPFSHCKEIDLHCHSLSLYNDKKTYKFNFRGMNFNSRSKAMKIASFSYAPTLPEASFARKAGVQRDRYEVHFSGSSLSGVDLDKMLRMEIIADALEVQNSVIKIYRDLRYPLEPESKVGNYPHQMLMKARFPINIKTGIFKNSFIEYMEKNPLSDSSGRVRFMESKLTWNNLTNIPAVIASNRTFTFNVQSKVLGKLPLQTAIKFDLLGKNGEFNISGRIGESDARALNAIAKPMALMEINTGFIRSMTFNLNGNDHEAKGNFEFRYDGVKVKLLKVEEDKSYKKKGIMSFVANTILKNENPHEGELRKYIVQYNRDPYKSFFNLIWKSIFVGIQETMGFPKGKERNVTRVK